MTQQRRLSPAEVRHVIRLARACPGTSGIDAAARAINAITDFIESLLSAPEHVWSTTGAIYIVRPSDAPEYFPDVLEHEPVRPWPPVIGPNGKRVRFPNEKPPRIVERRPGPNALKLNATDVQAIKAQLATGAKHADIAREFAVSRPTVSRIANGTLCGDVGVS